MIELIITEISENTFANLGELIDPVLINKKFNSVIGKNIDLRKTSTDKRLYINIGNSVSPDEINDIYNN